MRRHESSIFVWATPRSVSTALEKALSQHPKTEIIHEPFTSSYYYGSGRKSDRYLLKQKQEPCIPVDQSALFLNQNTDRVLVIKELAFQGDPYVNDSTLINSAHIAITRDPLDVYRSLVKLKPDFTSDEFGFVALSRIEQRLKALGKRFLHVVDGNKLRQNPEEVLRTVCAAISINFDESMLHWDDGRIQDWKPSEELSQARWHRTLEQSSGIFAPPVASKEIVKFANLSQKNIVNAAVANYRSFFPKASSSLETVLSYD